VENIAPQNNPATTRTYRSATEAAFPALYQQDLTGIMGPAYAASGFKDYASQYPDSVKLATDSLQRMADASLQLPGLPGTLGPTIARQPPPPLAGLMSEAGPGNREWLRTVQDDTIRRITGIPGQPFAASDSILRAVADTNDTVVRLIEAREAAVRDGLGVHPPIAPSRRATPAKKKAKKATPSEKAKKIRE
jgi:hypothetical protein